VKQKDYVRIMEGYVMYLMFELIGAIADMESQIETMRGSIAALKKPPKKERKHKDKSRGSLPSSSKLGKGGLKGVAGGKKKGKNKPVADDDVLTFEQKKDLSEAIQQLDGTKLERVIQIIHEGVPEIRDVGLAVSIIERFADHIY
jgi:hypothetical protein